MTTYLVTWDIHVEADTPEEAARQAQAIHRDPASIATVFVVQEVGLGDFNLGPAVVIDLDSDLAGE